MKTATICFHKNLSRYPENWIRDYRVSIESQVTKTVIFEIDYGCTGERIFKDSIYFEEAFTNHAEAHNYLCRKAIEEGFDFVANTNIDDLYHQERIFRQLPYCEKYDVVSCDMTHIDGENNITRKNILFSQMNIREHAAEGHNIIAHPACIYSKNFIENSGLLQPTEEMKSGKAKWRDDFDLWLRSFDKFSFFIVPYVLFFYRIHAGNVSSKMYMPNSDENYINQLRKQEN